MTGALFVLLSRPGSADACLRAAAAIAGCLEPPEICAIFIRREPEEMIVTGEEVLTPLRRAALEDAEQERRAAIGREFEAWRTGHGRARLLETSGGVRRALEEQARGAGLIVAPQARHPRLFEERQAIDTVIFDSRRPVLVVPEGWRQGCLGERVAIAWKEDEPARRAVLAARPVLARATVVMALTVGPDGASSDEGFVAALRAIDVAPPDLEHIDPSGLTTGATLLKAAHVRGADMIVAGAYSHRQIVERLLGGVTRELLQDADIPVLMAH
jgi:nucleotide-binding universal stress UspA family protein